MLQLPAVAPTSATDAGERRWAVLRAAGAALIVDVTGPSLPQVLHWGADLGAVEPTDIEGLLAGWTGPLPASAIDGHWPLTLVPSELDGWSGTPGFSGHRAGADTLPVWRLREPVTVDVSGEAEPKTHREEGGSLTVVAGDEGAGLRLNLSLQLDRHGVLTWRATVTNEGTDVYDLVALRALLPLPARAQEVLDLTGRWCRERSPQRSPMSQGTHQRSSRRGRTGHDATLLLMSGTSGFGMRKGEVWGSHVAWSGDHEHLVERLPEGAGGLSGVIGGGELLRAGEVRLKASQCYSSPSVVFVWSGCGMDGLSDRLHRHLRDRPSHPRSVRPLVLNTWEAVYFDHDLRRMKQLADVAAAIGVERFVIDDGWFRRRRNDAAGLGDWYVDEQVWPEGLHPIANHVHGLGLELGLWFEPEMVNPDSDVARTHPDWLLDMGPGRESPPWRGQHVLDLAHPDAFAYLLERMDALITEYAVDFVKWDHNRDLHCALHNDVASGRLLPGVHRQTLATYALLDELRRRHPALEIESCSSGGARVDLGIVARTDRVWASDTNDAIERQQIQMWTGLLLPPELIGAHVGPKRSHTTGRELDLPFRLATALFGHAGLEWDVTSCTVEELAQITAWAALYRELRPLLHGGRVVRADAVDHGSLLHGIVADDRRSAVYCFARLTTSPAATPGRTPLPGLEPNVSYAIRERDEIGSAAAFTDAAREPAWRVQPRTQMSGRALEQAGLALPLLQPGQAIILHLTAT